MGLAIAANTGGTITLVGTPPNLIASGALTAVGLPGFSFLEFAWIGIPLSVVSVIYMVLIGRRLCPKNFADVGAIDNPGAAQGDTRSRWVCTAILVFVIAGLVFGIPGLDSSMVAVIGALACVLTKCISEKAAYEGIDWVTIFLFAGMLPLANALDSTGAGNMIADFVVGLLGDNPSPTLFMFVLFALSVNLTQFMSNTAAAALLCPIGISISTKMGCSPYPVIMAIGIAASCAFTTPVATPPNALVMGPGGFKFMDYLKVGVPLVFIAMFLCLFIIPWAWPFYPENMVQVPVK